MTRQSTRCVFFLVSGGSRVGQSMTLTYAWLEWFLRHPLISVAVVVFLLASMWRVFEKAGQPGWAALIPIVNLFFLAKIADKPMWTVALFFVPVLNVVTALIFAVS